MLQSNPSCSENYEELLMLYLYLLSKVPRKYCVFENAGICQNVSVANQKKYMSYKDNKSKLVPNVAFEGQCLGTVG